MSASISGVDGSDGLVVIGTSGYVSEVVGICLAAGRSVVAIHGDGQVEANAAALGIESIVPTDGATYAELPTGCPVALAIGRSDERAAARERLIGQGHRVETLVHPDAVIGPDVTLGPGTVVSPGARITAAVRIGTGCLIHTSAVVSHDDRIGDYVAVSPGATLTGGVTLGDHVFVGAGATILPGSTIGAGAVIGGGAVVTGDVEPGATVAGVPARPIG